MARNFASGEKVFAKMRGYPAWPARIEGLADSNPNNIKYHVLFYGTMQRGICKSHELFPYLEYKEKFGKGSKAKGFKEALDQIEGLAPIPELVPKIVDEKYRNDINYQVIGNALLNKNNINNNKNDTKGKRNKTSERKQKNKEVYEVQASSVINNGNDIQNCSSKPQRQHSKVSKSDQMRQKKNIESCNSAILPPNAKQNKANFHLKRQSEGPELPLNTKHKEQKNAEICLEVDLSSNISHSQKGRKPNRKFIEKPSKPSSSSDVSSEQIQPDTSNRFVSRSGRVIKRKTFHDETEESTPKRQKVHRSREENIRNPSRQQIKNQTNHRIQSHLSQNIQSLSSTLIQTLPYSEVYLVTPKEKKQTARRWLATENCMTKLDSLIRAQLGVTRANPQQCIRFLEDMAELDLEPLMLKKHPEVVETIKRLRKYVGNAGAWNFSEEQKKAFEELAQQIRRKAEYIFDKFRVLFSVPSNSSFLEVFADSVVKFQTTTQHWPLAKIYALVSEPKAKVAKHPKSSTPLKQPKPSQLFQKTNPPKIQTKSSRTSKKQTKGCLAKSSKRSR